MSRGIVLPMNNIFDLLAHVVEHVGGWASDEVKAEAHKLIAAEAEKAGEPLTSPPVPPAPAPAEVPAAPATPEPAAPAAEANPF